MELCVPHLSWMGSSGTPPEAQAHRYPRRLAVRSLDVKAPSRPPVSHPHVIDAGDRFLRSLRWSSRPYDATMVLTSLSSVPRRSLLPFEWLSAWCVLRCLGGRDISIPPRPCAAAIRLASPRSCPPIHPRAAATLLVGLGSRFRRHDRAGTVHSAHGDALRRRRAHHVTAPGGDEIFRHGSTMAPPLTGCSLSKI